MRAVLHTNNSVQHRTTQHNLKEEETQQWSVKLHNNLRDRFTRTITSTTRSAASVQAWKLRERASPLSYYGVCWFGAGLEVVQASGVRKFVRD
jgi:hypothetical protein